MTQARGRAAAVLKVAGGLSARKVAHEGLLRPRDPETIATRVELDRRRGAAGLNSSQQLEK